MVGAAITMLLRIIFALILVSPAIRAPVAVPCIILSGIECLSVRSGFGEGDALSLSGWDDPANTGNQLTRMIESRRIRVMDTSDLEHAQDLLLSHLQESLPGSLSASGALRWLVGQDVGEEVARAAMWDLIY